MTLILTKKMSDRERRVGQKAIPSSVMKTRGNPRGVFLSHFLVSLSLLLLFSFNTYFNVLGIAPSFQHLQVLLVLDIEVSSSHSRPIDFWPYSRSRAFLLYVGRSCFSYVHFSYHQLGSQQSPAS